MATLKSRGREFEARRARGVQLARRASAALRKAGFAKAGPYRPYGHREPGFQCFEVGHGTCDRPTAAVVAVGDERKAADYADALRAAGFTVSREPRFGALRITTEEGQ